MLHQHFGRLNNTSQNKMAMSRVEQLISSRHIIEASDFDVYLVDPASLRIECVSEGLTKSTGYSKNELLNLTIYDLNAEYDEPQMLDILKPLIEKREKSVIMQTLRKNKCGEVVSVSGCIQYVVEAGSPRFIIMVHEKTDDVTMQPNGNLVDGLLAASGNATVITDASLNIKQANYAGCYLLEKTWEEIEGQNIRSIGSGFELQVIDTMLDSLTKQGSWEGVIWKSHTNGDLFPICLRACRYEITLTADFGYVFVLSDMSKAEIELHLLANQNTLTGLPNRIQFLEKTNRIIQNVECKQDLHAIFHIDINNFKKVNELFGHAAGDEIIIAVAKRIASKIKDTDILSNLGADEFALFAPNVKSQQQATIIADRLIKDFDAPFIYQGHHLRITISVGIALSNDDNLTAEILLQQAEKAVNSAKINGKSNFHLYNQDSESELASKFVLESELHQAIKKQEFELFYQPQLDVVSGEIKSAEALLRWNHPEKGLIGPDKFIPILEDSELIIPVGKWVIREACYFAKKLQVFGCKPIQVAVNVSALQLKDESIIDILSDALEDSKLDPQWLEIEITESSVVKNTEKSIALMKQINALGISISMDDFGTGYSSLSHLKKMPLKTLKIDQSFVSGIPNDLEDLSIVKAIVAMSKALNLEIVAEGVETAEQLAMLRNLDCNKLQGFLIGRPVCALSFLKQLNQSHKKQTEFLVQHNQHNQDEHSKKISPSSVIYS